MQNITFGEEVSWPLSKTFIGIDIGGEDYSACNHCGERLATNEIAQQHAGKCDFGLSDETIKKLQDSNEDCHEHVDEKEWKEKYRTCPYKGCPDPFTMRPPCVLCYE